MSAQSDRALGYGAQGAGLGLAVGGPVGAGIGGALGAGYGWLTGGGSDENSYEERMRRANAAAGSVDGSYGVPEYQSQYNAFGRAANGDSSFRGDQLGFGNTLRQEAMGQGVGQRLVGMQAQQAADRASNQQFAALGAARPGMQAMASRNAMLGSALAQSAVGEQAALGSANMTLGAQGQYGQFLQGARGQDISQQGQNLAALNSRAALAGQQQQGAQFLGNMQNSRWQTAYGNTNPQQPSQLDKGLGMFGGALSAYNMRPGQGGGAPLPQNNTGLDMNSLNRRYGGGGYV